MPNCVQCNCTRPISDHRHHDSWKMSFHSLNSFLTSSRVQRMVRTQEFVYFSKQLTSIIKFSIDERAQKNSRCRSGEEYTDNSLHFLVRFENRQLYVLVVESFTRGILLSLGIVECGIRIWKSRQWCLCCISVSLETSLVLRRKRN